MQAPRTDRFQRQTPQLDPIIPQIDRQTHLAYGRQTPQTDPTDRQTPQTDPACIQTLGQRGHGAIIQ